MKGIHAIVAVAAVAANLSSAPRDIEQTYDLVKKGRALTAREAADLERRLEKQPNDQESRIELMEYYARLEAEPDTGPVKEARARHILWLIKNHPKGGLRLFEIATGSYRLHCQGDRLADPGAFRSAASLWLEQVKAHPGDGDIRSAAVDAVQFCDPESAERLLLDANDQAGLGRLYAIAVLGITGLSYANNDPAGSDAAFRERPFAAKARRALEEAADKDLIIAAAQTLLRNGGVLWADGKLDWDYTALGEPLLAKALRAAPDDFFLLTLPTKLPARGERPPATLRVGGSVMQGNLVRQVTPKYPETARALGIVGKVALMALIGLDGKVMHLRSTSGPAELIPASIEAVEQWEYKPIMLNGKPCYVSTRIDVNFTLGR
jgi:hypothetical protein